MQKLPDGFDVLFEELGAPTFSSSVEKIDFASWTSKLPDALLSFWKVHGFAQFKNGLFQFVDPKDWSSFVTAVFHKDRDFAPEKTHVIGRSAFLRLMLWSEEHEYIDLDLTEYILSAEGLFDPAAKGTPDINLVSALLLIPDGAADLEDDNGRPMFDRAVKRNGPLAPDEAFGFVPALPLGGTRDLEHVKRVKAREHALMLAQLQPIELVRFDGPQATVVCTLGG
jgi:hypothetical protein